ncbi:PaaI family thioesterase [uncultured Corynebacterium sp.]|uniref:PaaI family thioesterase n=1 Tax=uncultured Corynebacterium sp. TaxID=159447 RepID=UPI00259B999E|nr:PaaI family thioesterase [uncultured Corynebacterium sp.]
MNLEKQSRLYREVIEAPLSEEELAFVNTTAFDFAQTLGLQLTYCAQDRLEGELAVDQRHLQPTGIANGGLYCVIGETLASIGAVAACAKPAVGMSNYTDLLGSVRDGETIRAVARPVHVGKRTHLWRVEMRSGDKLVAVTNLKLMVLDN